MQKGEKNSSKSLVDSRDVKLHYLSKRVERNGGPQAHKELMEEIEHRMFVDELFSSSFPEHKSNELIVEPMNWDCLKFMIESTEESCGMFTDYSLKYVKNLVHICETSDNFEVTVALQKIRKFCSEKTE